MNINDENIEMVRMNKGKWITQDNIEIIQSSAIINPFGVSPLEVMVGTNGKQGGDSGHGCRTSFAIVGRDGTAVINADAFVENEIPCGVRFEVGGDCELETLIYALEFAVAELKEIKNFTEK